MNNIYANDNNSYDMEKMAELFSVPNIEIDEGIKIINEIFNYKFSFDVSQIGVKSLKLTLYTPIKIVCGFFEASNTEELGNKAGKCIIDLIKKYFVCSKQQKTTPAENINNQEIKEENTNIALSTINEIEEVQKEMETNKDNKIIKEQVEFINNFKNKYEVDDAKFNNCISIWNKTAKTNIKTKQDLAQSDYNTVQSFINWIINTEENKNKEEVSFVTPSSDETGVIW